MRQPALLLLAGSVLALSACASLAPYGPATSSSSQGYVEQRIESDRFRITYRGVGAAGPVADRALLRASELTTETGNEWFEVTQRYIDGRPDSAGGFRPSLGVSAGSGRYGGYASSGIGVGLNFSGPSPTSTVLEVRMGRGQRPDRPEVYDAREVQSALQR